MPPTVSDNFGGGIDKAHEGVELKLRPSFFPPGA
mgnify:CR=1 FL=1